MPAKYPCLVPPPSPPAINVSRYVKKIYRAENYFAVRSAYGFLGKIWATEQKYHFICFEDI